MQRMNKIRVGYLNHTDLMFSIIEQIEEGKNRPPKISKKHREELQKTYKGLKANYKSLLLLGITYHDIGKQFVWRGHADIGTDIFEFAFKKAYFDNNSRIDIIRGYWKRRLKKPHAHLFLKLLIKHHEVLGNCFTGEQTVLAFIPVFNKLKKTNKNLIGPFLEVLLLLTVCEVGSVGYLDNTKIDYYFGILKELKKPKGSKYNFLKKQLLEHVRDDKNFTNRLRGLGYSFSGCMDHHKKDYEAAIDENIKIIAEKKELNIEDFKEGMLKIIKFAYALGHFNNLTGMASGTRDDDDNSRLKALIILLWSMANVANACKNKLNEIEFLEDPGKIDYDKFKNKLIKNGVKSIDEINLPLNKDTKILDALFKEAIITHGDNPKLVIKKLQ